ncbi:MAG: chloride channel protein [Imperialibacter sp.]|uniref:chloride channel protein n=1 Tax=Imperialibacter sp. TaxID=2038411 RepID=UPI0032EE87F5
MFGWGSNFCVKFFKSIFEKRPLPIYVKTLIGGILLGVIAFYFPLTRYFGHHEINGLLAGTLSLGLLFAILAFKILAISITVTSGWRGGFIIPLFFVGATLGLILQHLFPAINLTLTIVSCMAAINACVTRTPMSTMILLATLTGFGHFIPILFASLTGYFLAPRIPFISSQMEKEQKIAIPISPGRSFRLRLKPSRPYVCLHTFSYLTPLVIFSEIGGRLTE